MTGLTCQPQATNGLAVNVTAADTAQVRGAIQSFLEEETRDLPYVLTYRAPSAGTGVRKAGVSISKAKAEAPYEVGATSADARKVCALDLTIRIGTREIKRRLCGQEGRGVMTKEEQDAFHGALLGEHLIALEGPAPSRSTMLDDIITARLMAATHCAICFAWVWRRRSSRTRRDADVVLSLEEGASPVEIYPR